MVVLSDRGIKWSVVRSTSSLPTKESTLYHVSLTESRLAEDIRRETVTLSNGRRG